MGFLELLEARGSRAGRGVREIAKGGQTCDAKNKQADKRNLSKTTWAETGNGSMSKRIQAVDHHPKALALPWLPRAARGLRGEERGLHRGGEPGAAGGAHGMLQKNDPSESKPRFENKS